MINQILISLTIVAVSSRDSRAAVVCTMLSSFVRIDVVALTEILHGDETWPLLLDPI